MGLSSYELPRSCPPLVRQNAELQVYPVGSIPSDLDQNFYDDPFSSTSGFSAHVMFERDLTEEGIEPNPGPGELELNFGIQDLIDGTKDLFNFLVGESPPEWKHTHSSLDGYVTHGTYVLPPHKPSPLPRLVGVETNPGPVTLPTKGRGNVSKNLASEVVKLAKTDRKLRGEKQKVLQPKQKIGGSIRPQKEVAAAYSSGFSTGVPNISATKGGKLICHRELVNIVSGTATFTATTIPMQPGLGGSFTWLATQCNGWEKYRWKRLVVTYLTRTGTNVPGTVMLVPDYDAADAAPTSELQASSFHGVEDDAPWKTINMTFDMARSTELFIRSGPLAPNLDIKTYDFANLYVCTTDGAAANWGKVYIYYEIELINAQAVLIGGGLGGNANSTVGPSLVLPLGTLPTVAQGSYITSVGSASGGNASMVNLTNMVVGGEYQVFVYITGTGLTAISLTTPGLTLKFTIETFPNVAGTAIQGVYTFIASASSGNFNFAVTGTTCTGAYFSIAPVSATNAGF